MERNDRDAVLDCIAKLLETYEPLDPHQIMSPADAFFAYRLLLYRNPDPSLELRGLLSPVQTYAAFLAGLLASDEFFRTGGLIPANRHLMAEVEGFRFWFDTTDREMGVRMGLGVYEPKSVELVRRIVRPGMCCLDVGAQTGFYTCLMASLVGRRGTVYAFEPMPANYNLLVKNVRENGYSPWVHHYQRAASDTTKAIHGSLISHMWVAGHVDGAEAADIEAVRIEDIVRGKVDFMKIDVEGHEPAALEGMASLLRDSQPLIVSEVNEYWLQTGSHSSGEAYLGLLMDLGYDIYNVADPQKPLTRRSLPASIDSPPIDIIAVPRGRTVQEYTRVPG